MATNTFPDGFLWGTATSSHQVEGNNVNNDWWEWEQKSGNIKNGDRSGAACDGWNRYAAAIDKGIDVPGYFYWTSTDNFEWSEGYYQRFGIIEVDFATQARTVRPSGRLYGEIARQNRVPG